MTDEQDEQQLDEIALLNTTAILAARNRAETELRNTKEELRATAERLKVALQISGLGDWSWDLRTGEVVLGERAAEILGVQGAVSFNDLLSCIVHSEDRKHLQQAIERAKAGHDDFGIEHRILHPSGEIRWVSSVGRWIYGPTGEPVELTGVIQDISERKNMDIALRESEARFRQLADAMPQIVWAADAQGKVDYFNRRWHEITGVPEKPLEDAGKSCVHPDDLDVREDAWRASLDSGRPFEIEYRLKTVTGYRWHLSRALPVRSENGTITRWFGSSTDIDDQKRTEQRLRDESRVLEVINRTGTAIASSLDLESVVQTITDAATEISGAEFGAFFYNSITSDGECLRLYTLSGAPKHAFEGFGHPRPTALFGPTFRGEEPIRCDDILKDARYGKNSPHSGMPKGHLPVRSYLGVPVISRSGEVIGGLFFGHSRTGMFDERSERLVVAVATQAAVAFDNATLYRDAKRVSKERQEALEVERSARQNAEQVNRMKDEFLATLSHELRTPLTAILGWAHVLRTETDDPVKIVQGVEAIVRNARAQTQLVDDLLDMNSIVSGKIHLETQRVDLAQIIHIAIDSVKLQFEAKGIQLRTVIDPFADKVVGDPSRLQQVFWNLLTNAVKFTPNGGSVEVRLERLGSSVVAAVSDTGKGIAAEFLPHVFDRFRQADASSTRVHGGLGLGLSIVKQLVELHGGTIQAQSLGEGAGATFTVTLPVPPHQPSVDEQEEDPLLGHLEERAGDTSLEGVKVLVVEDDADSRELIATILSQHQARVTTAISADEALALVSSFQPHVVVSDIGMPGKSGYQLIKELRSRPPEQGGRIPALALSAYAHQEDREKAFNSGFQQHAAKPVVPKDLIAMVAALVGGGQ